MRLEQKEALDTRVRNELDEARKRVEDFTAATRAIARAGASARTLAERARQAANFRAELDAAEAEYESTPWATDDE
jgi:uncharacterized protein involved in exopolysaccharide biosynthesis